MGGELEALRFVSSDEVRYTGFCHVSTRYLWDLPLSENVCLDNAEVIHGISIREVDGDLKKSLIECI